MPYKNLIKRKQYQKEYSRKWTKNNPEKVRKIYKKWKKGINPQILRDTQRRSQQSSFKLFLAHSIRHIKSNDKKMRGLEHNIDLEYVLELLELQNYRCALSGIRLTHYFNDLRAVSIDRIDSSKGHIKGNVQLVCQFVNLGKRDRSDDAVRSIVQEIELNLLKQLKERGYLKLGV